MAEQKIQAGKTIDTVTKKELHDALGQHLRSWIAETAIGGRFARFAGTGTIASTAVTIGGANATQDLGPGPGFVWDVRRLRITANSGTINSADIFGIFINDPGPASLVARSDDVVVSQRAWEWNGNVVLYPGDTLLVQSLNTLVTTGGLIVSGQVLELPVGLAWKLTSA
jgi:hypothetical protein